MDKCFVLELSILCFIILWIVAGVIGSYNVLSSYWRMYEKDLASGRLPRVYPVSMSGGDWAMVFLILIAPGIVLGVLWFERVLVKRLIVFLAYIVYSSPQLILVLKPQMYAPPYPYVPSSSLGILFFTNMHNIVICYSSSNSILYNSITIVSLSTLVFTPLILYTCIAILMHRIKPGGVPLAFVATSVILTVAYITSLYHIKAHFELTRTDPLYIISLTYVISLLSISWLLMLLGALIFIYSTVYLWYSRSMGVDVVVDGAYSVIRHPQYIVLLSFTLGLSWYCLGYSHSGSDTLYLWIIQFTIFLVVAYLEERVLTRVYGVDYRDYMGRTSRLLCLRFF